MCLMTVCASHSPLLTRDRGPSPAPGFQAALNRVAGMIADFKPDFVVEFGPDHYNGFFYDMMPNFCVGVVANSVGDWGTLSGPLDVPKEVALAITGAARAADIDVDLSYRMQVDHGFAQLLEMMFQDLTKYPIVPLMINCAGAPLPTFRRSRLLGEAVGRYLVGIGKRVVILGSGGLSHDPPIPQLQTATEPQLEFLIAGRNPSVEARSAREGRALDAAKRLIAGDISCLPPSLKWDREFTEMVARGNIAAFDCWKDEEVTDLGGCGAHEIRTWVAAFAAQSTFGPYEAKVEYHEVVPEWLTGMCVMTAVQRT
jgi:2,3-dihydroxyphenylpropionate 1,2-dioxygenase